MIAFMVSIIDHPYFKSDFIIEDKFGTTHKIKQRLHDIKTVRNKLCHNQDLEAREVYESLDNIQRFFELFQENMPNKFS